MQFEEVKELIAIFEKTDLNDMEVHLDNAIVRLNRGKAAPLLPVTPDFNTVAGPESVFAAGKVNFSASQAAPAEDAAAETGDNKEESGQEYIKAPIVGTFYQSPSPEKPPYVNVGDKVSKGDIVCIIEAMKFMNEVTSEVDGEIAEILVEDGEFVEFGKPLFRLV